MSNAWEIEETRERARSSLCSTNWPWKPQGWRS